MISMHSYNVVIHYACFMIGVMGYPLVPTSCKVSCDFQQSKLTFDSQHYSIVPAVIKYNAMQ